MITGPILGSRSNRYKKKCQLLKVILGFIYLTYRLMDVELGDVELFRDCDLLSRHLGKGTEAAE